MAEKLKDQWSGEPQEWRPFTTEESIIVGGHVTSRTDVAEVSSGRIYRTIVTVRKGAEIVTASVSMTSLKV